MANNSRDVDYINRSSSPMKMVEENTHENLKEIAEKNKQIDIVQNMRSRILLLYSLKFALLCANLMKIRNNLIFN